MKGNERQVVGVVGVFVVGDGDATVTFFEKNENWNNSLRRAQMIMSRRMRNLEAKAMK